MNPRVATAPAPAPAPPTAPAADETVVACRGLTKRFGPVTALDGIDLDVRRGELVALLGPSGCGKTTGLRLVAGFDRPDTGTIALDGDVVVGSRRFVAPERRRVGMVFQDYALFPHLSVARNIGYGVRERARRQARVDELLEIVGLTGKGDRLPHELSGGEQQRVALARALAPDPSIVLLDEPFSNLDASLRSQVRAEVRAILDLAQATAVMVTHDQEEALSMADRVAVIRAGRILQIDRPVEVYERPTDPFVATFVGEADLVPGHADGASAATAIGPVRLTRPIAHGPVDVVVRPERVELHLDADGPATVRSVTYLGHDRLVTVTLPDGTAVRSRTGPDRPFAPGDRVAVTVSGEAVAFPASADR